MELKVLKNIAESIFNLPTKIMEEDSPRVFHGMYHDGSHGMSKVEIKVYQYTKERGFFPVDAVDFRWSSNYAYDEPSYEPATENLTLGLPVLVLVNSFSDWGREDEPCHEKYAKLYADVELPF